MQAARAHGSSARLFALQEALAAARSANQGGKAAWLRLAAELEPAQRVKKQAGTRQRSAKPAGRKPDASDAVMAVPGSSRQTKRQSALGTAGASDAPPAPPSPAPDGSRRLERAKPASRRVDRSEATPSPTNAPSPAGPARHDGTASVLDPRLIRLMNSLDCRRPANADRAAEMLVIMFGLGASSLAQNWIIQMQSELDAEAVLAWTNVAAAVSARLAVKLQGLALAPGDQQAA